MTRQWLQRWQDGNIGWHEAQGNVSLQKYWNQSGKRVLVPLCGKSLDLVWLEGQGNEVVGVELSELAVMAFFDENEIAYTLIEGPLNAYVAKGRAITIFCGDFFRFSAERFDAYYDRGALIALPPEMRQEYVAHVRTLLAENAAKLVVTVEYDETIATGPPFSVPASEVLDYWPEFQRIAAYDDIANCPPKFKEAGLNRMLEVVWRYP